MSNWKPRERRNFRLAILAVGVLGLFIVFFDLNGYRTLTKHEGFVAVVSREMLQTGDWVVPRFGGLPRLKKPPLAYWCAAGTSWMFGEHAPWTARFPFAVSALLLAVLVGVWAGRWYGRWQGIAAAMVQISSVYVISFSRKAEVDMLLCLLTTSALFLVANAPRDEERRKAAIRWIGIYALIGLAWLAKFHYGPAMVLGVVAAWHLFDRRRPRFWEAFNPLGLIVLAACVVIWPWLLLQRVPEAWQIWQTETIGRALGDLGREPIWFYIPQVFVLALPWSFLLWPAARTSYRRAWREADSRERFLWVWFGTQFLILTASAFKHHHYLMAVMPALSLILGRELVTIWSNLRQGNLIVKKSLAFIIAGLFLAAGIGAAAGISHRWPHLHFAAVSLGICLASAGLIATLLLAARKWTPAAVTVGIGFVICSSIVTAVVFPNRDRRLPSVQFAANVRSEVPRGQPICLYGLKEDPLVYYLEGRVFRLESREELQAELEQAGSLNLITDEANLQQLANLPYRIERQPEPASAREMSPHFVLVKIQPLAVASPLRD